MTTRDKHLDRDPIEQLINEMKRRASDRGCMGAVSIDGVCATSELPLVDWCDECVMSHLCYLRDKQADALLGSARLQKETTADGIARVRELVANLRIANAEYEKAEGVSALKVASYSLALAARKFLRDFYELDAAFSAVLGQSALPRTEK